MGKSPESSCLSEWLFTGHRGGKEPPLYFLASVSSVSDDKRFSGSKNCPQRLAGETNRRSKRRDAQVFRGGWFKAQGSKFNGVKGRSVADDLIR